MARRSLRRATYLVTVTRINIKKKDIDTTIYYPFVIAALPRRGRGEPSPSTAIAVIAIVVARPLLLPLQVCVISVISERPLAASVQRLSLFAPFFTSHHACFIFLVLQA